MGRIGELRIRTKASHVALRVQVKADFSLGALGHPAWMQRKSTVRQIWEWGSPAMM